jgi:hypothetical protein
VATQELYILAIGFSFLFFYLRSKNSESGNKVCLNSSSIVLLGLKRKNAEEPKEMSPLLPIFDTTGKIIFELLKGRNMKLASRFSDGHKQRLDRVRELSQAVYPNYSSDRLLKAIKELDDYYKAYENEIKNSSSNSSSVN